MRGRVRAREEECAFREKLFMREEGGWHVQECMSEDECVVGRRNM